MSINWSPSEKQYLAWNILQDKIHTEIFYGGGAGGGKAQPYNSLILTKKGYVRMGDLTIGDTILTPDNNESKIIGIHEQGLQDVYEVTFIDGSKVCCTNNHLWYGHFSYKKTVNNPVPLNKIISKKHNFLIPFPDKLEFGERYNKIHPYLIGVMLGDGNSKSMKFTTSDDEIVDRIRSFGFKISKDKQKYIYSIITKKHDKRGFCYSDELNELRRIRVIGKTCSTKKIPNVILDGDSWTRLECLKGLMDTDGCIDSRGHCEFTSKSKELAKGVQYLVRSLGGKATFSKCIKYCYYKGVKKEGNYFRLYIRSNHDNEFFFLKRKSSRFKLYNGQGNMHKRIKSVKKTDKKQNCRCISINSHKQLYVTDDFTVTHNSYLGCAWLIISCLKYQGSRWLMGRAVLKTLKQTTLLTFFDICKDWGLKPVRDYKYNENAGSIKWVNGSEIYLKDLAYYPADPEYDSLGSTEYTGAFIDEASQIKSKAKNIVMSRLRYKLDEFGLVPKTLIASNPSKNFLYKEFYRPWKDKKLKAYRCFIPSLVQDNPFISEHYIRNLYKLDPVSKQRLLYGNFDYDDDPAKMFEYDDIIDLFTNHPDKSKEKYLTCDVARKGKNKTTIFYWEGLLCRGIWAYPYTLVNQTVKLLEQKEKELQVKRSHMAIDEDGVGGGVVDYLPGCRGFINNSAAIPHSATKSNYANLKSQCYFHMADLVKQGKIGIRTSKVEFQEMIIEELEQIKQKDADKDGKLAVMGKKYIEDNIGRSPDFADALMVRMLFEVSQTRVRILPDPDNVTGLY